MQMFIEIEVEFCFFNSRNISLSVINHGHYIFKVLLYIFLPPDRMPRIQSPEMHLCEFFRKEHFENQTNMHIHVNT